MDFEEDTVTGAGTKKRKEARTRNSLNGHNEEVR
jgi:hypothetical protein